MTELKFIQEKLPPPVLLAAKELIKAGYKAYLVGGSVRDLLIGRAVFDYDLTTKATPEQIQAIFPDSFYENDFGTVGLKDEENQENKIEITTFRKETTYSDFRHPDKVVFAKKIEEDLERRDFTINAIAVNLKSFELVDPFLGIQDLEKKTIKAVGRAQERFQEDALRLIRAVRFATQLNFKIEEKTQQAIQKNRKLLEKIAKERIKDEFQKIILAKNPEKGINQLQKLGLLEFVLPELEKGLGMEQNHHHVYNVYDHALNSLKFCPSDKLEVRLAALLHDIAKPDTLRTQKGRRTFYNHDFIGAKIARRILQRLRFSNKIIEKTVLLIKNHMFYYEVGTVTEASVRRLIKKVGQGNIKDLIDLRIADRLGSGCPKAKPYKLRHLEYLVEKVSKDPISVKMLKIDGNDLNQKAGVKKGPKMGKILEVLLGEVLDDPKKNELKQLIKRAQELKEKDLKELTQMAKEKIELKKIEEDKVLKEKYWLK